MEATFAARPIPKCPFIYEARPGQKFFLDEFITPLHYRIFVITRNLKGDFQTVGKALWDRVMSRIQYVLDRDQFGTEEFFQFPFEVLKRMKGDCEDTANLLTSMLRACGIMAKTVYGTVELEGNLYKHAWTEVDPDILLESTMKEFRPVHRPSYYHPEVEVRWEYAARVGYPPRPAWPFRERLSFAFGYGLEEEELEEEEDLIPEEEGGDENTNSEEGEPRFTLPKLTPEELKKLHEKLLKAEGGEG